MTTNDGTEYGGGFGGGPSTVVALFTYGDVILQTHNCLIRDAVFAARVAARCEAQSRTLAEACVAVGDEAAKGIYERIKPLRNWPLSIVHPPQDALIDRSRALCVKNFLEQTEAEVLIMIDHDQDWCGPVYDETGKIVYEGDICHLARKCAETKGVIGAAVSKKTRGEGIATMWRPESYGEHQLGSDEVLPVFYVGAAFTAYHRSVLRAVTDSMKEIPPGFAPTFLPMVVPHPNFPDQELHLSEDWAFCHRANELGFPVNVSLKPLINHWGHYPYAVVKDAMADVTPRRRISLVHATRGRPLMAMQSKCNWLSRISGNHDIEYVRVRDTDDQAEYLDEADEPPLMGEHRGCVDAYNRGAAAATGDILVQMHDDLTPPPNWDAWLAKALDPSKPQVLEVSDGLPKQVNGDGGLIPIAIVTRPWMQKMGGLFHPGYVSVYCDNDLTQKARKEGAVVEAKHLVFQHRWEGPDRDETQRRSYAAANWDQGKALLKEREQAGFPDAD